MPTLDVDRRADANWRAGYRQGRADATRPPSPALLALAGLVGLRVGSRRRKRHTAAARGLLLVVLFAVALTARVGLWIWPYRYQLAAGLCVAAWAVVVWCWWPRREPWL